MNARLVGLLAALPILGAIYIAVFTDWLKPAPIEVVPSIRAILPKKAYGTVEKEFAGVYPVIFSFDVEYSLTSVRVEEATPADGAKPQVLWELRSRKGSKPVKAMLYGRDLDNMDPVPGTPNPPHALQAGKQYRLLVEAGRRKGSTLFSTRDMADLRPNY